MPRAGKVSYESLMMDSRRWLWYIVSLTMKVRTLCYRCLRAIGALTARMLYRKTLRML